MVRLRKSNMRMGLVALAVCGLAATPAMAGGGRGWSRSCSDGFSVSSWGGSRGSGFSVSISSGWNDCGPRPVYSRPVYSRPVYHRPVYVCPPPVVVSRPVVYTQPVVYAAPVVVEPVRVVQPVVQQAVYQPAVQQVSYQPTYQAPVLAPAPATLATGVAPAAPVSSAAEDLTRALAAANQGEDRRAVELMRAYFRIYATPPAGLVLSRPMLERLEGAYARRCELEEPNADTYFVLAVLRGLLGDRVGGTAALDAGRAWGDRDGSAAQARAWLESR
ncbi:MAG: hypothetical protein KF705_08055 [Phycisphaeraceae bacterium]|nr:hypothetical protein [Phycisphaeraceae bacterium]